MDNIIAASTLSHNSKSPTPQYLYSIRNQEFEYNDIDNMISVSTPSHYSKNQIPKNPTPNPNIFE